MVTMVHEYCEVKLLVKIARRGQLGTIVPERHGSARGIRPTLEGRIDFEGVSFRYSANDTLASDQATFTIARGAVFGVVGCSGSGKTTITRLIQEFTCHSRASSDLDGVDLRELDRVHLRGSIGVVNR